MSEIKEHTKVELRKLEFKMPERTKEGELHLKIHRLYQDLRKMTNQLRYVASDEIYWKEKAEEFLLQSESLAKEKKELEEKLQKIEADNRMWGWMHKELAKKNLTLRNERKRTLGLEH